MHLVVIAVVSAAVVAIPVLWKIYRNTARRLPPGPPTLPIIGNLHQLILSRSPLHVTMWKLARSHAPHLMTIRIGRVSTLVVSSPKIARDVFRTHDVAFSGRRTQAAMRSWTHNYSGIIFSPYGEYWRDLRKVSVLHLFSSKKVQSFAFVRREEVARMVDAISAVCSTSVEPIDLTDLIHSYANSIIFRIAFGKRFDHKLEASRVRNICKDIQEVSIRFCVEDYFPALAWVDWLTGLRSLARKNFEETYSFLQEIVDEHRAAAPKSSRGEEDLTDVLIRLKNENTTVITHDNHIKSILADVLVAGTDTTSSTLVWIMTELVRNPRVMVKAQQEVRNSVSPKGENTLIEEEDVPSLPYLQAVIKETFRLDPIVPLLVPRKVIESCTINGYQILPGIEACVNVWAIGRDPDVWDRPEEFWPERFLHRDIDYKGKDFELLPFGAGRRACPGMMLGISSVELALANLLYWFDWKLPAGTTDICMDSFPGTALQKKTPLCLSPTKYQPLASLPDPNAT